MPALDVRQRRPLPNLGADSPSGGQVGFAFTLMFSIHVLLSFLHVKVQQVVRSQVISSKAFSGSVPRQPGAGARLTLWDLL